ncbi:ABC transporter permease [Pannonibacter tanglangensis]|uniref:ABC transporter permease subunit n=1 Tax=Pannonibacter tanglangensis TaxID=2750084 RepID=A0ABW9ZL52_9HYPH|nr:ABC transporter permease [Pannonibacter sp. XCT-34]NBN64768.1 ABC transporter permease subunit [Pannonibacter sp. XCT-34]
MRRQLLSRIGQAALVLWAAFTVSFLLLQALPGDAVLIRFLGGDLGLSPEQIAELRVLYGADAPLWEQYLVTLGGFLTGNFGYSVISGTPVATEILTNLPPTLWLAGLSLAAATVLAAIIALAASLSGSGALKTTLESLPSLMISVPVFWLGIVMIQVFSFQLGWVSVINPGPWEQLVLPVIAIAVPISAPLAQILLRNIEAVSRQPFIHVARAKGATRVQVLLRHSLGNAVLPSLTVAGLLFGELIAGAVITETVFGLNGLGRLAERSVRFQDTAVLQAIVVISALAFLLINLTVDLLYPLLDPRLRRPDPKGALA